MSYVEDLDIPMAHKTRRLQPQMMAFFDSPERMSESRRTMVAPATSDERNRPTRPGESTLKCKKLIARLSIKAFD